MISNEKAETPKTLNMNDENYLNCVLESLKNMTNNLSIALNEASNETLYQQLKAIFNNISNMQRKVYELAFSLGWYSLEKEQSDKINQAQKQLKEKMNELIK